MIEESSNIQGIEALTLLRGSREARHRRGEEGSSPAHPSVQETSGPGQSGAPRQSPPMAEPVDELDELDIREFLSPEQLKQLEEEKKMAQVTSCSSSLASLPVIFPPDP